MIYITGDCHGDFTRFSNKHYGKGFRKNDIVIVCGDFGLLWQKDRTYEYWKKFFSNINYIVLWISGNHENYNWLYEFPVEVWNGGKVRKIIGDKCIYLERGQVFTMEGKKFFTFGGASSHDIQGGILERDDPSYDVLRHEAVKKGLPYRVLNESWWKQELPTKEEMQEGLNNLAKERNKVDYIITHCASNCIQNKIQLYYSELAFTTGTYKTDILTDYFEKIESLVDFKQWFFGHYHNELIVDDKHILSYTHIIKLV